MSYKKFQAVHKQPESKYFAGDRVKYEGQVYAVVAATHTHAQLEGLPYAIPNWQLVTYRRLKKNSSVWWLIYLYQV